MLVAEPLHATEPRGDAAVAVEQRQFRLELPTGD